MIDEIKRKALHKEKLTRNEVAYLEHKAKYLKEELSQINSLLHPAWVLCDGDHKQSDRCSRCLQHNGYIPNPEYVE